MAMLVSNKFAFFHLWSIAKEAHITVLATKIPLTCDQLMQALHTVFNQVSEVGSQQCLVNGNATQV